MSWLSEALHAVGQNPAVISGLISGTATLMAAGVVTWRLNRGMKRAEFVIGFASRYHLILHEKHKLNREYVKVRQAGPPTEHVVELEEMDAKEIYRQLFGLMFDEYFSYQRHLLDQSVFAEWMKWRMDDFNGGGNYEFKICDLSYRQGWDHCKLMGPFRDDPCKQFLHEIHECRNYESVERKVRRYKPTVFWRSVRWMMGA